MIKLLITLFLIYSFTPFPAISPSTDSITVKGGLLTNNGTNQVESPPCANGEIIEWDSAEVLGYKCVVKPVASAANYVLSPSTGTNVTTTSISWVIRASAVITTTGNPVKVDIVSTLIGPNNSGCYNYLQGTSDTSYVAILRDGVELARYSASPATSTDQQEDATLSVVDIQAAGTYTYSIAHSTLTGNGTSYLSNCSLFAQEIK